MNRIFHARIAMGQYLFLILIGILAVYMLWYKSPFLAAIFMLWLVVIIEKLIRPTGSWCCPSAVSPGVRKF